jgi:polyhydroxybutyrate depolymerase
MMMFQNLRAAARRSLGVAALALVPMTVSALSFLPFENTRVFYDGFEFNGSLRTVGYIRPAQPRANSPAIVVLHFNLGAAPAMANLTEIAELVRDENLWVILPQAPELVWSHVPGQEENDDVGYLAALIDAAVARFNLDARRIYMTGYSQGANMTIRMACDFPEKIAAGAAVAGTMRVSLAEQCAPRVATPMVFFHGTADDQVPYQPTLGNNALPILTGNDSLSAPGAAAYWAAINGCEGSPQRTDLPSPINDQTSVYVERYTACSRGGAALYTIVNGGHNWPGALDFVPRIGLTTQNLRANREMWAFFRQFAR